MPVEGSSPSWRTEACDLFVVFNHFALEDFDLAHHFHDMEQQNTANKFGMWLFLVQETLFFAGLFMAYIAFRYLYPETWLESAEQLDKTMGGINTVVLLTSSLTMALAVRAAQVDDQKNLQRLLLATIAGAFGFIRIDCRRRNVELLIVPRSVVLVVVLVLVAGALDLPCATKDGPRNRIGWVGGSEGWKRRGCR